MSSIDTNLLDALRKLGVVIPKAKPIAVRSVEERKYWHITCGSFDTFVDDRDASNIADVCIVAMHPLQAWYICDAVPDGLAQTVKIATKNEYLEWLRRGVS